MYSLSKVTLSLMIYTEKSFNVSRFVSQGSDVPCAPEWCYLTTVNFISSSVLQSHR